MRYFKLILFCVLILFTVSSSGQVIPDSILFAATGKPDTAQITYFSNLCWKYRNVKGHLALACGEQGLEIARKIQDRNREAKLLNLIGVVYRGLGENNKAVSAFVNALGIAQDCKDSVEMGYAENNLGGTYRLKFDNITALDHVFKGLRIFEKLNDKKGMAFCTINIGIIYQRLHNYQKAFEYLQLTAKLRKETGDIPGEALAYSNIASLYLEQKLYDQAFEKYTELEIIYTKLADLPSLVNVYAGMSEIYTERKDYANALKYQEKSLDISAQIKSLTGKVIGHRNLALIYANLGKFGKADLNIQTAVSLSEMVNDRFYKLSCYKAASKIAEMEGELKKALLFMNKYTELKDSIINRENIAGVSEMEAVYKNEKNKRENALLQKSVEFSETQKTYWIIITILFVFSSLVLYARFLLKKKANRELSELNKMKDLLLGIIAHDLKNPFHNIIGSSQILLDDLDTMSKEEMRQIIGIIANTSKQTYALLENLLYWTLSQTGKVNYSPESIRVREVIQSAFELSEGAAQAKNIQLISEIDDNLTVHCDREMMKTVFRNLISNGVKYSHQGGKVAVTAEKENDIIKITVADTGIGMPAEMLNSINRYEQTVSTPGTSGEKGTGLGLVLCRTFIEKNGGHFSIESQPGQGSRFIFTVPESAKKTPTKA